MQNKRTEILNTTLVLVSEYGFHGTSIDMIANKAGVGVGTIYRNFGNKDNLFAELFLRLRRTMYKVWSDGLTASDNVTSFQERFRIIWLNAFTYYLDHPQEMQFMEQFIHSPFMNSEIRASLAPDSNPLDKFHQEGLKVGIFKDMPLVMRSTFTVSVIISLAELQISGQLVLDDEMREMAIKGCWDAISN